MAEPRQQNLFSLQECHRGRWLLPFSHREEPAQGLVSLLIKVCTLKFYFYFAKGERHKHFPLRGGLIIYSANTKAAASGHALTSGSPYPRCGRGWGIGQLMLLLT